LSEEVFTKVERLFLLGLRASDPLRRQRFFDLYHTYVANGLFERLQFIICTQDWQVRGWDLAFLVQHLPLQPCVWLLMTQGSTACHPGLNTAHTPDFPSPEDTQLTSVSQYPSPLNVHTGYGWPLLAQISTGLDTGSAQGR
jgi:hypothetical protein